MDIQSSLPLAFSQIGQRETNQDALYPATDAADEPTNLFIVCDGMGGADKGEVASQLLCAAVVAYAQSFDYPVLDAVHLQTALDWAYGGYQDYLNKHPLVGRMGSTLALLQFHQRGATVAHIGDSRVYQLRDGKIIFRTKDHRQVDDMVETGIITATQALTHPWRNRLSRAVVAESGRDGNSFRATPDITLLTDIRAGDCFFLCTDGVLEQVDDLGLALLLTSNVPGQAKIQALLAQCDGITKDNYSGFLLTIDQVAQTEKIISDVAF
jgi:protein phosphatase